MNNTPSKKSSQQSQSIKKTGNKIPQMEPSDHNPQSGEQTIQKNRLACILGKMKEHYLITTIVVCVILLASILTPVLVMVIRSQSETIIYAGPIMTVPLKSGGTFNSAAFDIKKNSKNIDLTINTLTPSGKRLLQGDTSNPTQINYYHKESQISISYDMHLNGQFRIPCDTGTSIVLQNAPPSSEAALSEMPQYLPPAIISSIEKSTGMKATVSTDVSYDGVYNKQKKQYTILTQKNSYHPDEFAKITSDETNLLSKKPEVSNYNDIVEVTKKIAEVVSNIAENVKQVINENKEKLEKLVGPIEQKKTSLKSSNEAAAPGSDLSKNYDLVKCTRVGDEVIRCPKGTWQSGELKVSNIGDKDPIEVWEIVVDVQ